jgi:hypothetical protein
MARPIPVPFFIKIAITAVDKARIEYCETSISPITMEMNKPAAIIPNIELFIVKLRIFLIVKKYGEVKEKNTHIIIKAKNILNISPEKSNFLDIFLHK